MISACTCKHGTTTNSNVSQRIVLDQIAQLGDENVRSASWLDGGLPLWTNGGKHTSHVENVRCVQDVQHFIRIAEKTKCLDDNSVSVTPAAAPMIKELLNLFSEPKVMPASVGTTAILTKSNRDNVLRVVVARSQYFCNYPRVKSIFDICDAHCFN